MTCACGSRCQQIPLNHYEFWNHFLTPMSEHSYFLFQFALVTSLCLEFVHQLNCQEAAKT